ncbi:MAG: NTP transferase domain-containing protein [Actinobacteria bacterium]|nr:NTP transferase domain-containing protein [Actinomycetota bacterium]
MNPAHDEHTVGAILLAGGRASRVGGATKPLFDVGGRTLLSRAVAAARDAGCHPIVVIGSEAELWSSELGTGLTWARENPPFAGPAAAVIAALDALDSLEVPEGIDALHPPHARAIGTPGADHGPDWMLLLACDLPRVDVAVQRLVKDIVLLPPDTDGLCLGDASSRPQWLIGIYRTAPLRRGALSLPDSGRDASVRALLADLAIAVVADPDEVHPLTADIDTWEDLDRARRAEEQS